MRLFEAAACSTPIISDTWPGLDELFEPGSEILLARTADDTLAYLNEMPADERQEIGRNARARVLESHTAAHRAAELESFVREAHGAASRRPAPGAAAGLLS